MQVHRFVSLKCSSRSTKSWSTLRTPRPLPGTLSRRQREMSGDSNLSQAAQSLRAGLEGVIRNQGGGLFRSGHKNVFTGAEAVRALRGDGNGASEDEALAIGQALMREGVISNVHPSRTEFKNSDKELYRFAFNEAKFHGGQAGGNASSWADALFNGADGTQLGNLQAELPSWDPTGFQTLAGAPPVTPLDTYNAQLLDAVRPKNWVNPTPSSRYNLVVIGAGAGGLVSAAGAAGVGAKVAIIEEHLMGGDCLNVGCVPSKAILRCARAAHQAKNLEQFGVKVKGEVEVDFAAVMERMRRLRAQIAPNDSARRFADLGVDVFLGRGRFTGRNTIQVDGKTLTFSTAVIATGGRPKAPPIPGLDEVPYLDNRTIFNLTERPARLGIIGSGPIGVEMGQAFQRLGSQVIMMGRSTRILEKEDPEAASLLLNTLRSDGVDFRLGVKFRQVRKGPSGTIELLLENSDSQEEVVTVDALLVATGRSPNVSDMGLEKAGVAFDTQKGISVNDYLQSSARNIYAVGDCCTRYQFTHIADFMARMVVRNALFFGSGRFSSMLIPWCTYTQPEIGHVGLYPHDLEARGIPYETYTKELKDNDRAILEGQTEGFVTIHCRAKSDKILGATIVGENAGDLICEVAVAIQAGMGLGQLASVIHPYPTQADAIRACGDLYNKTRLTPFVKSLFKGLLAVQR
eukprot:jgi/Botrbrau1/7976/Bobra.384_2s0004.1